jgi:hypothetical protein
VTWRLAGFEFASLVYDHNHEYCLSLLHGVSVHNRGGRFIYAVLDIWTSM